LCKKEKTTHLVVVSTYENVKKVFSYRSREFYGIAVETWPPHQVYYTIHWIRDYYSKQIYGCKDV